jgi:hypothetical protein
MAPHLASECHDVVAVEATTIQEEQPVEEITPVGLDLAKNIFQAHGITSDGTVAFQARTETRQTLQTTRCRITGIRTEEDTSLQGR